MMPFLSKRVILSEVGAFFAPPQSKDLLFVAQANAPA